jgi:hypothetical protein
MMANKVKFVVALGALLGIVGVFLPLAQASAKLPGGGMFGLGLSLWSAASVVGAGFLAYAVLGGYLLAGIFAVLGVAKRFGRGFAVGALLTSIAPAALSVYWLSQGLSLKATGVGLVLLAVGGILAAGGSVAALVSPERREPARAPATAAA